MDPQLRKQLLLTRIALDRVELRYGTTQVRQSFGAPLLWRALVGAGVGKASFGGGKTDAAGWLRLGLTLLRRYRLAATVLGGLAPLLGLRRQAKGGLRSTWRRALGLAAIGTAAWFGWRALRSGSGSRGRGANPQDAT
jgi:hypothetical protein